MVTSGHAANPLAGATNMAVRANAFVLQRDIDVPRGSIYCIEEQWFLRALVHEDHGGDSLQVGIRLNNAELYVVHRPTSAITLAPGLALQLRVIGEVSGPGVPPKTSLVWTSDGGHAISMGNFFVNFDGNETAEVNKSAAYFATHWGVWVIDDDGKPVSPDPLAIIGVTE
ncbi:hypothetical protein R5576_21905 (plasmid) [Xanthomonas euvesicatoria]|nr:hypothetical protein [Xanthomonas euvesicatoria]WOP54533.1 hypothetical protein R5576_21905 [Xanthomonas euvesicatoria]WOP58971.1 hypothetical protein R5577_22025 [Xanthomonas euvesicatoria]